MWTKNHILVSAKAHNLFYPSVGTLFDPACMEATQSDAPFAISSVDALCLAWSGNLPGEPVPSEGAVQARPFPTKTRRVFRWPLLP
jgi:hypothetical protein